VQIDIAQMMTKYISDISPEDPLAKMPWLCESEAMRYPTSPLATMANPRIDDGYNDFGFGGKVTAELLLEVVASGSS
jgi:hypothetical protein